MHKYNIFINHINNTFPIDYLKMMDRDRERKRDDIIIELGYEETKVGTSSDKLPRKSIKSYGIFEQQDFNSSWEARV